MRAKVRRSSDDLRSEHQSIYMHIHTKVLNSICDLNDAKELESENFYFSRRRFLASNLRSYMFHLLAILISIFFFFSFSGLGFVQSLLLGYVSMTMYVVPTIFYRWHRTTTTGLKGKDNFMLFWLRHRHALIGLYQDHTLIGVAGIHTTHQAHVCELERMWVLEKHRRQGSGAILLNAIVAEAKKLKFRKIILSSGGNLFEAIDFYQKNHFRFIKKVNQFSVLPRNPFQVYYFDKNI